VAVGGRPLDPAQRYSVATDSFLADGGDGYGVFTQAGDRVDRQLPMRDLLLAALRDRPLKASLEGRIAFTGQAAPPDEHQHPAMAPHDR